jgi:hypothetical protein
VFDVYAEDQCRAAIASGIERSGPLNVLDVRGPVPWQWDTTAGPVPFELSLEVLVEREVDGAPTQAWSHFPIDLADGSLGWVTFCDQ